MATPKNDVFIGLWLENCYLVWWWGGGMGHFFLKNWNNNIYFRTLDLYLAAKNLLYGFSLLIKEATNLCNKPRLNSVNQNQCINTTS